MEIESYRMVNIDYITRKLKGICEKCEGKMCDNCEIKDVLDHIK